MVYNKSLTYNEFRDNNKGSGVYKINIISTGQYYVGSSKDVRQRISQHMVYAHYNRHTIVELNKSHSLFGREDFSFELLASCPVEDLTNLENYYQTFYESPLLLRKQRVKRQEKISIPLKIKTLQHIDGTIVEFSNIAKFCKEYSLPGYKDVQKVLGGNKKFYKGWYRLGEVPNTIPKEIKPKTPIGRTVTVYDPEGNEIILTNIAQFCRDNNLNHSSFYSMVTRREVSYKGYTLSPNKPKKYSKVVRLVDADGIVYEANSVSEFSKKYSIPSKRLSLLINGQIKSYKGYSLDNQSKISFKNTVTGEIVSCFKIADFCRLAGVKPSAITKVVHGYRKSHKDWELHYSI